MTGIPSGPIMPVMSNGQAQIKSQFPVEKYAELKTAGKISIKLTTDKNPEFTLKYQDPWGAGEQTRVFVNLKEDIQREIDNRQDRIDKLTAEQAHYQEIITDIEKLGG